MSRYVKIGEFFEHLRVFELTLVIGSRDFWNSAEKEVAHEREEVFLPFHRDAIFGSGLGRRFGRRKYSNHRLIVQVRSDDCDGRQWWFGRKGPHHRNPGRRSCDVAISRQHRSFKLQGADQFDKDAIPALIKRNFKFQCGSELVQGLPTVWFEQDAFSGRGGTFSKTVGDRLLADAVDFGLYCLSLREDAWIFKARFTMRSSAGSYSPDQQTVLLDEIIGLRPAEPILIGFPHTDSKKGKTIYWVALLLEKE
ncbi:MAG: hypothetical protein GYA74_06005 [Acidobacteria bacterium]|nr:hypothetical protein [Acidobacteriota bacterium]NMD10710.1 hypothetical protein [Acidobacteriota bacterium]